MFASMLNYSLHYSGANKITPMAQSKFATITKFWYERRMLYITCCLGALNHQPKCQGDRKNYLGKHSDVSVKYDLYTSFWI